MDISSKTATNYQDISRAAQNMAVNNAVVSGTNDTQIVTKGQSEQKKNTNESSQQNDSNEVNSQRIKNAVNQANDKMKNVRTGCEFSYNDELNTVTIKVYDKDTKEVIKEIPSEESLKILEKVWEIAGLLVDEKR